MAKLKKVILLVLAAATFAFSCLALASCSFGHNNSSNVVAWFIP